MLVSGKLSQATTHDVAARRYAFQGRQVACRTSRVLTAPRHSSRMSCRAEAATAEVPVYKGDLFNKSYYPTGADAANLNKNWYIIDAKGKTLGRLATLAATYVRGKHLPTYTPSMDMGAFVIIINAEQVEVTGNKSNTKGYFRHVNGRPGAWRIEYFKDLQKRIPERIVEKAVQGMLPKGRLGRRIRLHLKVFKGEAHPHIAQQPVDITHLINTKPAEGIVL